MWNLINSARFTFWENTSEESFFLKLLNEKYVKK